MTNDDLLTRIQQNGRLHGRNESRRVVTTVLGVLSELLPAPAYRRLTAALPEELRERLPHPEPGRIVEILDVRRFLARIAERLYADSTDAAFLVRVVLAELNTADRGIRPAQLAHLVPTDLRPLFRSRPAEPWFAPATQPWSVPATHTWPATAAHPQPVPAHPGPAAVLPPPAAVLPPPAPVLPVPAAVLPAPAAVLPTPAAVQPQPAAAQLQPVAVQPQPAAVLPQPVAAQLQPVAVQPQPAAVLAQPVAAQLQPVAAQPQPVLV
ncbi:DUF2267 domain-containing protein [Actinoplanes oblitus]|uniref:DUF2267 domain-containing protein n=1 Tax=Actinoplanes oblitus TaxID=3040509 RepID=A0ABY8WAQ2_9ACTN|nr:DUF2267 domain-containing protein [Actinoplanes oblitus]WIM93523.1 DUF2267 domain-containing protein [Actinoplanes oblitus]